ncbi:MAG TPA: protein kinase, partial [Pyrinomonadaceae bacterium]|nr:protein kinase [Pyrinomonadaceae bacterium]
MNSQKFDELFAAALELAPAERSAFLAKECAGDEQLLKKLASLLQSDAEAENEFFLARPAAALDAENLLETFADSRVGKIIGRWKIVGQIGAGGMGTVYLAERADEQFKKQAALKLVKRGMDTDEILRRFLRERQILANLEHPNIARLLDAGMTDDGLPFFVMELVEGAPIDEFCRERNLSINQKLELFRLICLAIAHAHRNLIVHRDLKPSNILVATNGEPKLLDFGIAKLLGETEAEHTQTNLRVLTMAYAAPEQKTGGIITTATDVYSLGLILSELLGVSPIAISRNSQKIRTLETNGQKATDGKRQSNFLPADLRTILQTALRDEPVRRYGSAEKFADDIENYLNDLPISARRDTFFYRAGKFISRNRLAASAAVLVFLAVLTGVAATVRQAQIAKIERERAENRFNDARELAQSVIFKYHDEIANLQGATKVRKMMVADALRYLDRLSNDAAAQDANLRIELAEAYLRMGDVQGQPYYANIGDTAGAIESYRKAVRLLESFAADEKNAAAMDVLADSYERLSNVLVRAVNSKEERSALIRQSIELREKIVRLSPNAKSRTALALGYLTLGQLSEVGANENESIPIFQTGVEIAENLLRDEPDNLELLLTKVKFDGRIGFHFSQLARREMTFWKTEEARRFYQSSIPYFERAIVSAERLRAIDSNNKIYRRAVFVNKANLGEVLAAINRPDEGLKLLFEALHYAEDVLKTDAANREVKFEIAEGHLDIGRAFLLKGDVKSAERYFESGIKLLDELIAADPKNTQFVEFQIDNLSSYYGDAQIKIGDYEGALKNYRRAMSKAAESGVINESARKAYISFIQMRFGDVFRFRAGAK